MQHKYFPLIGVQFHPEKNTLWAQIRDPRQSDQGEHDRILGIVQDTVQRVF